MMWKERDTKIRFSNRLIKWLSLTIYYNSNYLLGNSTSDTLIWPDLERQI